MTIEENKLEKIIKRLGNLLSVMSLVTLLLTVIFGVLSLRGDISGKDFLTIFLMVVTFYFGTQSQKAQNALDEGSTTYRCVKGTDREASSTRARSSSRRFMSDTAPF